MFEYEVVINGRVVAQRRRVAPEDRAAVEAQLVSLADDAAAAARCPAPVYRLERDQPMRLLHAARVTARPKAAARTSGGSDAKSMPLDAAAARMLSRETRSEASAARAESAQARLRSRQLRRAIEERTEPQ